MSPPETIENVSDTALWVAMYRAFETERADALFRDPHARRLAGPRGEQILRSIPGGRGAAWAMITRTVLFDDVVMRSVRERGVDTVLNLAAGLDTRPWRLELPAALRWIDVDLPAMLDYKQRELAGETPKCRYEARPADLREAATRRALFADVGAGSKSVLVVSEGLLIYLADDDVAGLAESLAAEPTFRWWMIDLASPLLIKRMQRQWGRRMERGNAPFRFAPAEGTRFFKPHGWTEREFHSIWETSQRLHREMPPAWLWKLLARFAKPEMREQWKRFSGAVLLERSAAR